MNSMPELFGLYGFSHGWARILTVMSPRGIGAILATVQPGYGLRLEAGEGRLPRFHEIREGELDRLIEDYGIVILNKQEWDARKRQFSDTIYL